MSEKSNFKIRPPMAGRVRMGMIFSYEGTQYRGWQRQPGFGDTLQQLIEDLLYRLCQQRCVVMSSGRTDAGVHARVQVCHVDLPEAFVLRYKDLSRITHGINRLLPPDVRLLKMWPAHEYFHAQKHAQKKTYLYFIDTNQVQSPMLARYSWHLRLPMNWRAIARASELFVGKHDFLNFCASDSTVKTTVRKVHEVQWGQWPGAVGFTGRPLAVFRITGSGFLKHMVRSIVGTLVGVGNGKRTVDDVKYLLDPTQNKTGVLRHGVGQTAPAHGLWLWDVAYERRDMGDFEDEEKSDIDLKIR